MTALHQPPNIANDNLDNLPPYLKRLRSDKKKVMSAPCRHKFHSPCLIYWMTIKMECPICRNPLPPL